MTSDVPLELVLAQLNLYFQERYGVEDAIVKLGVTPEAFEAIVREFYQSGAARYLNTVEVGRSLEIRGVEFLPRRKEMF